MFSGLVGSHNLKLSREFHPTIKVALALRIGEITAILNCNVLGFMYEKGWSKRASDHAVRELRLAVV